MERRKEQRIAVARLHLKDGSVKRNQLLIFSEGRLKCYYPLTAEEAFTKWFGGDFYIESPDLTLL